MFIASSSSNKLKSIISALWDFIAKCAECYCNWILSRRPRSSRCNHERLIQFWCVPSLISACADKKSNEWASEESDKNPLFPMDSIKIKRSLWWLVMVIHSDFCASCLIDFTPKISPFQCRYLLWLHIHFICFYHTFALIDKTLHGSALFIARKKLQITKRRGQLLRMRSGTTLFFKKIYIRNESLTKIMFFTDNEIAVKMHDIGERKSLILPKFIIKNLKRITFDICE